MRKKTGLLITRIRFRKRTLPPTTFTSLYSNASSALVIIPENPDHRSVVLPFLNNLHAKFRGNRLTIIVHNTFKDLSASFTQSTIIPMKDEDLNFFFLPKPNFAQRIFRQKFDLVVDLNVSMVPAAAYLCRGVNAPLKVSFVKEHSDAFYNFQFNTSPYRNPRVRYDQLLRTLSMF